ncbi:MAG TPA: HAD family phosphatase [Jatrophihabitantaceae bacterium]|nr:HAD family phosphatase [Jatrophihabitantaceae bacterium]
MLQAVLFDMDGTIVDTEPYWIAAEYRLVESFGGTWSDEHAHALVGNALIASAEYLREHGGVALPPEEIVERLLDEVVRATREAVPWRPGAVELLAELGRRAVPCALVTMSYDRLAQVVVDQLPAGTFGALVTGDQVADGKPHPEAYLTAAARLGVDPRQCVAIEDSPTGVASAEAAGCTVVAVPHNVPIEPAPGRRLVASLRDVSADTLGAMVTEQPQRLRP